MARTSAKAAGKAMAKAKPKADKAMAKAKPQAAGKTSAKASIWDRAREEGRKALKALDHLAGPTVGGEQECSFLAVGSRNASRGRAAKRNKLCGALR